MRQAKTEIISGNKMFRSKGQALSKLTFLSRVKNQLKPWFLTAGLAFPKSIVYSKKPNQDKHFSMFRPIL